MKAPDIAERLKAKFPDAVLEVQTDAKQPWIKIRPQDLAEVARTLHDNPELSFDALMCLSGVDYPNELAGVYHLFSYKHRHAIVVKTFVPKTDAHVPTVSGLWRGADWFEREAFDLLGIVFDGHPDLRRLMMPEDWVGHPLRKDYQEPERYLGMDTPRKYPTAAPAEEPKKVA
ncbi:MAG: NADH-quinone oxidoreductase subunit C [Nitrospirae bacterium]|nr:NADH-quinone oxidoreductase subunit C [Nitrospirota bacterium]